MKNIAPEVYTFINDKKWTNLINLAATRPGLSPRSAVELGQNTPPV